MKGSYLLILNLAKNTKLFVGALKKLEFKSGYYCYVGSAFGQNTSIENRTKRHEQINKTKDRKRLRWHIDYFLANQDVNITQIYALPSETRNECLESSKIAVIGKPVPGFGNTDCKRCDSHFYYLGKDLKRFKNFILNN